MRAQVIVPPCDHLSANLYPARAEPWPHRSLRSGASSAPLRAFGAGRVPAAGLFARALIALWLRRRHLPLSAASALSQGQLRLVILLPSQTSGSYLRSTTRSFIGISALSVILMCSGQTSVQHLVMLQ